MRRYWLLYLLLLCLPTQAAPPNTAAVSLDLCMDWLMAYYLKPEQVKALSPLHRRYPVQWIGQHWPSHDGSLEQIYSLKPELVLVGEFAAGPLRKRLSELGINVQVFKLPNSLQAVYEYEKQFLRAVNLPETLASAPPPALPAPHKPQRLLLLGANGIGTGTGTLEDEILRHAGWQNYLTREGYQSLDMEQLLQDPPDAIMWSAPEHRALANQFAEHQALRRVIPAKRWLNTEYWRWQCPGPWTWELIGQLNQWLE